MAYNKITSHFSSSKVFTNDKYFSYDNSSNKASFVDFIDFQDNTIEITGSGNKLFITGNIRQKNDITSSLFRLDNNAGIFFNDRDHFIKNNNNNISINSSNNVEITGSSSGQKVLINNGITGSLINVDSSGKKLLKPISGISVSVENESTSGLDRFVLNASSDTLNDTGVTYLHALLGNIPKSLVCTGSERVAHYQQSTNLFSVSERNNDVGTAFFIDLERLTNEHKDYMKKGKFHIIYFDKISGGNHHESEANLVKSEFYLPENIFSIGATLILISSGFLPRTLYLPPGKQFFDGSDGGTQYRNKTPGESKRIGTEITGVSYVLKKISDTHWSLEDSGN